MKLNDRPVIISLWGQRIAPIIVRFYVIELDDQNLSIMIDRLITAALQFENST